MYYNSLLLLPPDGFVLCYFGLLVLTLWRFDDDVISPSPGKGRHTRHRYCSWHLQRNCFLNLQSMQKIHGEEVCTDYQKWYWSSTEEKFEMRWHELKLKYNLDERSWLSALYNRRDHWAPIFLKNIFTAGMKSTQRSEGMNAFFDGYVNAQTELHEFVKLYEDAVKDRRAAELDEDFRSINSIPILNSTHLIEKQGRKLYTRNMFAIFQQEFKCSPSLFHYKISRNDTKITYVISTMEEEDVHGVVSVSTVEDKVEHQKQYVVTFDASKMLVSCSCAKFETEENPM